MSPDPAATTGIAASTTISLTLDDAPEPFATYRPPATVSLDTRTLEDGPHVLRLVAVDSAGSIGRRTIRFTVANGPGISVTGLRDGRTVGGTVEFNVNAFSGAGPFDVERAESQNPIPVWMWVVIAVIGAWATWYGLEEFPTPFAFAQTPTYAANPAAAGLTASSAQAPPAASGKSLAGFDYGTAGASGYEQNCQACHGATGSGVPGAFPSLAHDPVVTASDPKAHIMTLLHGLHGKTIGGTKYSSPMPPFAQLSDATIAAIIDHERTSWGNAAPTIVPADVTRLR